MRQSKKKTWKQLSDAELFHVLLFTYQKVVRDVLGTGAAIFVHPTLECIKKLSKEIGFNPIKGKNLSQAFDNYSKMLQDSGLVRKVHFERLGPQKYMLHIDKCVYAKHIHPILKPENATCRYALLAMAIMENYSGKKVKPTDSKFTEEGTKTIIEC